MWWHCKIENSGIKQHSRFSLAGPFRVRFTKKYYGPRIRVLGGLGFRVNTHIPPPKKKNVENFGLRF